MHQAISKNLNGKNSLFCKLVNPFSLAFGLAFLMLGALWILKFPSPTAAQPLAAASTPIYVTRPVTTTTTWGLTSTLYVLSGTVTVNANVILTISPGVRVEGLTGSRLEVKGRLNAQGTTTSPITFTSQNERSADDWKGLYFNGGTGDLRHILVRFAGTSAISIEKSSGVSVVDSSLSDNGTNSNGFAFFADDNSAHITLKNTILANNGGYAIQVPVNSIHQVSGLTLRKNKIDRIRIGVKTGNSNLIGTLSYYTGLEAYELQGNVTVPATATLVISPGVKILAAKNVLLTIQGDLQALGEATKQITLTSATSMPGSWAGLEFNGTSNKGTGLLRYLTLQYAGASGGGVFAGLRAVDVKNGEIRLENSQILDNYLIGTNDKDFGIYAYNSHLSISETRIAGNNNGIVFGEDSAIFAWNSAVITLTDSVIKDNKERGLYLAVGAKATVICSTFTNNKLSALFVKDQPSTLNIFGSTIAGNGEGIGAWVNGDARYNWWGNITGPTTNENPGGTGDSLVKNVGKATFTPFLTQPQCLTNLSVSKTDDPDPVLASQPLFYTITVTNSAINLDDEDLGSFHTDIVTLTDKLPPGTTYLTSSVKCTDNAGLLTCGLGDFQPNERKQALLTVTVDPATRGIISNTVTITSTSFDFDSTDNIFTQTTTVIGQTKLSVQKDSLPNAVFSGDPLTYTITISNAGPSTALNTVITDTLPSGVSLDPNKPKPAGLNCNEQSGLIKCILDFLDPNRSTSFSLSTIANSQKDSISNEVAIQNSDPDPDLSDNKASATTSITNEVDVVLSKAKTNPGTVSAGSTLRHLLTLNNTGPATAFGLILTDTLPLSVTFLSATLDGIKCDNSSQKVICKLDSLAKGITANVVINAKIDPALRGTIKSVIDVSSKSRDSDLDSNQLTLDTTIESFANLSVAKTSLPSTQVSGGDPLEYTIVVTNSGPSAASNVLITDSLPTEMTYVSASVPGGTCNNAQEEVTCTLAHLAPNATATAKIKVTAGSVNKTAVENSVTVQSEDTDPDESDNTAKSSIDILAQPDLSIKKTVSPEMALPGKILTYTLEVQNAGPSKATGILITDTLPLKGIIFRSAQGCNHSDGLVKCSVESLAVNEKATFALVVNVNSDLRNSLTNQAKVSSKEFDPNQANNMASITTDVLVSIDLGLSKKSDPRFAVPNTVLTYTLNVSNTSLFPSYGGILTDTLPKEVSIQNTSQECVKIGQIAQCDLDIFLPNGQKNLTVTAKVADVATLGKVTTITNSAQLTLGKGEVDPNPTNNSVLLRTFTDHDGDNVPTYIEIEGRDSKGRTGYEKDTDNDGIPDYLDPDDDGDGVPTKDEDPDKDGNPLDDDSNDNGVPDYLDLDSPNPVVSQKGLFLPYIICAVQPTVTPAPTQPDLVVTSFTLSPDKKTFAAGEAVAINVVVQNQGKTASAPFWVDLYIDPTNPPTPGANTPWDRVSKYGITWGVETTLGSTGLGAGESVTLSTNPANYDSRFTIWPGYFRSGTINLYVYADSWNPTVIEGQVGAIKEADETNNIKSILGLQVTGPNPQMLLPQLTNLPQRPAQPGKVLNNSR